MFDIGWSEMVFVAIIAVLVIGPKDLPRAIATVGKYVRKLRGMAREFQSGIDDIAREADLDDLKKTIKGEDFDIKKQVEDAVDPTGDFGVVFDGEKKKTSTDQVENAETSGTSSSGETGSSETKVPS
ncbi:twin-arginine translocase subunit TatB [Sneathiella sp. P13V-1]|uniref:Sec-independent protein translocase protein TatB n=1 Tax=Sneathiella sp. P13V-1 TaxID=2697366 RepID=UPI00187B4A8B|nr:Sec-independent protein translocase protein TatB [Sneathiella sp. P13V-1]MBE7637680.1 twin-arginine translocase subunit TatB [Sneathiella sp. P13V-1]